MYDAVKELLYSTCTLFNPSLRLQCAKELWRLDDSDLVVREHHWEQLNQEVAPWTKVCIVDIEEVSLSSCECPAKVAGFLQPRSVISTDVLEAVACGKLLNGSHIAIVKDVYLELTLGILKFPDVLVGVFEDFKRLFTAWEVDVNRWTCFWRDRVLCDDLLMGFEVEVLANQSHSVRDEEVCLENSAENTKPSEVLGRDDEEPHTRCEAKKGKYTHRVQRQTVGMQISMLLLVCWSGWENEGSFEPWRICSKERCLGPPKNTKALFFSDGSGCRHLFLQGFYLIRCVVAEGVILIHGFVARDLFYIPQTSQARWMNWELSIVSVQKSSFSLR